MELPYIRKLPRYKVNTYAFKGIDRRNFGGQGRINSCMNISSKELPALVPVKSGDKTENISPDIKTAVNVNGKAAYIAGYDFYFDGVKKGTVSSQNPEMAVVGDHIIIAPEMSSYCVSKDEFKTASFSNRYMGAITFHRLYSSEINGWGFGGGINDYIYLPGASNLENVFSSGDIAVLEFEEPLVSGYVTTTIGRAELRVSSAKGSLIFFEVRTFNLSEYAYDGEDSRLVGGVKITPTSVKALTVSKKVINLNHICEKNNRLWGCNERTIYASKLGDPLILEEFQGLTTDSWALQTNSEGDFTGCISTPSYVVFFKENQMYKIYGNLPQNFQSISLKTSGVQKGSTKSLCSYNGLVFYLSDEGVMMFAGDEPFRISDALGEIHLTEGIGITDGRRLYISAGENSRNRFLVYDIEKKIWLEKSPENTVCFLNQGGEIRNISSDGKIYTVNEGTEYPDWYFEMGDFYENTFERKHYGKVLIHFDLGKNAEIKVEVRTDDKPYREYFSSTCEGRRSVQIPIKANLSEVISVRISGHGFCRIHSIGRELRKGSVGEC